MKSLWAVCAVLGRPWEVAPPEARLAGRHPVACLRGRGRRVATVTPLARPGGVKALVVRSGETAYCAVGWRRTAIQLQVLAALRDGSYRLSVTHR